MSSEEKIIAGIKLIKEGCRGIRNCYECPFDACGCIDLYTKPCFWGEEEGVEE